MLIKKNKLRNFFSEHNLQDTLWHHKDYKTQVFPLQL